MWKVTDPRELQQHIMSYMVIVFSVYLLTLFCAEFFASRHVSLFSSNSWHSGATPGVPWSPSFALPLRVPLQGPLGHVSIWSPQCAANPTPRLLFYFLYRLLACLLPILWGHQIRRMLLRLLLIKNLQLLQSKETINSKGDSRQFSVCTCDKWLNKWSTIKQTDEMLWSQCTLASARLFLMTRAKYYIQMTVHTQSALFFTLHWDISAVSLPIPMSSKSTIMADISVKQLLVRW